MRDIVGAAAAATLGFIHGNLRGAYGAYKLYQKYSRMPSQRSRYVAPRHTPYPTTPSTRGRVSPRYANIFSLPTSSRRSSMSSMRSYASSRRSRRTGSVKTGERKVIVKRKHVKGVEPKKSKKVKVSRKFAKKVNQVVNKSQYHSGYMLEFGGAPLPQIPASQQLVASFGPIADGQSGVMFSPTQVLNAASVLWNGKTYTVTPGHADSFNFYLNAKIKVKNLWSVIKTVNEGQRTYNIQFVLCKPKSKYSSNPITDWATSLTDDTSNGINIGTVAQTQLYSHPTMSKTFRSNWKTETSKIILEPGQSYDFHVQGPKGQTYDFQKFYGQGAVGYTNNIPKFTRYLMVIVNGDVLGMYDGTTGVFTGVPGTYDLTTASTSSKGYQLHFEYRYYYDIQCPDQSGWVSTGAAPAAGGVPLFERRDAYAVFNNYSPIVSTDRTARVDEENPTTAEGGGAAILS